RKQTLQEGAINSAKRMLADGKLTLEKIAEYAGRGSDYRFPACCCRKLPDKLPLRLLLNYRWY
ncbi:MAG: hypothetical protein K2H12_01050, partial [Acetatifactor sp.]|nr:hypothetical protein [Acetatifactor sp.]